jgi:thioredoxin reductase (NADPH)
MKETIKYTYDLLIVGGGPSGISCGIEATKSNLDYVILEKGMLVNSIYHFPTNMTFFSTAEKIEIGEIPFIAHNDKPTRMEALEYYRRLYKHYNLNIEFDTKVIEVAFENNEFRIVTNKNMFYAKHVVIATGYYDIFKPLNIPGENLSKVKHYYDDPHPYINKNIVIVGAANSACDVALETWAKGAKVTMVIRGDNFYKGVKYWILPNIENRVKEGSIKVFWNSELIKVNDRSVLIKTEEGDVEVANDYVLAMTGYQIDYDLLMKCGIKIDYDSEAHLPHFNPDTCETNIKGLYIAGVLLSGLATSKLFIENTRHHAEMILNDIKKNS